MLNVNDRRQERSTNLDAALELMLRVHRTRGDFDLMVLATTDGVVVAADGPRVACEELAAYAPLLARGMRLAIDRRRLRGVTVHSFTAGREELILVMRGGLDENVTSSVALASIQGAMRILRGCRRQR
jgi:hypothetical protein